MLRKTITLAIALVILLVVAFANAAPIRLANDAKVMTVYKGRNCPYTVSLYRENKQLTTTEIAAITKYVVIYDEAYYIDSDTCADCFTASGANVIVDLGTVNFAVGTDTAAEFIVYDALHPEGQVIGTIKVTIVDDAIAGGTLVDPLTSALADLGDVTITNPTNGQGLVYINGVWVNQTPAGGGDMLESEYNTAGTVGVVDQAATITNQGDLATMDAPPADDGIFYGMLNRVWTQISSTVDWTQPNQGVIDPTNYVDNDTTLSDEQVQDKIGAMFTGNTETRVTVTYQDDDGTIDIVVDDMNDDQTAAEVSYANTTSGMTATDTQAAIDEIEGRVDANDAKVSNVPTAISIGTKTATTLAITSDGGADDVVLPEADTDNAGLLGADKWDEIVANSAARHADESDASTTVKGIIEIADDTEALAGIDTGKAMTPAGVKIYGDANYTPTSYNSTLATNASYSGKTDTVTVGENVSFGQLLYHNLTDNEWYLATGGATAAELPAEVLSLGAATDGNTLTVLRMGYVRYDSWAWTVDGSRKMLYASTSTSGTIIENPASVTAGQYTQIIGTINSATTIFFNPGIYFQTAAE